MKLNSLLKISQLRKSFRILHEKIRQKKFEWFLTLKRLDKLQRSILPRKHNFTISNICTSNCVFCAYQYNRDRTAVMTNELFEKICRQIAALDKNSWISLTPTVGEPLTDSELFKKIETAKNLGIKRVEIYSNGSLLKKNVEKILSSRLDELYISFPDFNENEYKLIFRTNNYKISLAGIHELMREHRKRDSKLHIHINIRGRRNPVEVLKEEDFLRCIKPFLSDKVTYDFTSKFDNWGGLIKQDQLPSGMILRQPADKSGLPCKQLFELMYLPSGDIKLCGCRFLGTMFDDLVVGNIYKDNLENIWYGKKTFDLRNKFFSGEYPVVCKDCSGYKKLPYNILLISR
jgi:MoaA/NifB/PqqE/SkfB family radical SAM enzyme